VIAIKDLTLIYQGFQDRVNFLIQGQYLALVRSAVRVVVKFVLLFGLDNQEARRKKAIMLRLTSCLR
jgi:hypothetical protein